MPRPTAKGSDDQDAPGRADVRFCSYAYAFSAAIFRFENGKVVEMWNHRDDFGLTEQIESPIYAREARAERNE